MHYKNLKPVGINVLFERDLVEERFFGSIIIPEVRDYDARWGTVISVGEGRFIDGKYVPLLVEPGDRIMVSSFDGDKIDRLNDRIQVVGEDCILAKLSKNSKVNKELSDS